MPLALPRPLLAVLDTAAGFVIGVDFAAGVDIVAVVLDFAFFAVFCCTRGYRCCWCCCGFLLLLLLLLLQHSPSFIYVAAVMYVALAPRARFVPYFFLLVSHSSRINRSYKKKNCPPNAMLPRTRTNQRSELVVLHVPTVALDILLFLHPRPRPPANPPPRDTTRPRATPRPDATSRG